MNDYFGLCPRCCREPVRRDIATSNFMCCDWCNVYWSIGSVFTTYGDESDDLQVAALFDTYDAVECDA